jgi:hypothetical protein
MSCVRPHPDGALLDVKVSPGARQSRIGGIAHAALSIAVTAVAERGKANRAVVDLLCKALRVRRSQVTLLAGESSRHKRFLLAGCSADELRQRLAALADRAEK